jgi:hypothetical protein
MSNRDINKTEDVFRNSTSVDQLFDTFQDALKLGITDIALYKILLSNPALSTDEIKLFTQKLIKDFPQHTFELLMWSASIFESCVDDRYGPENAFLYYSKAMEVEPTSHKPLLAILGLYNYDAEVLSNHKVIDIIVSNIQPVQLKSKVYYALADHYKKNGNYSIASIYFEMGEKAAHKENEQEEQNQ